MRTQARVILGLFLLGMAFRSLVLAIILRSDQLGDAPQYLTLAANLRDGFYSLDGVNPSALRAPLYPIFLAATDGSYFSLFVQAMLGVFTALLLYATFQKIAPKVAALIGLLAILSWPDACINAQFLSETLVGFLLIAAFCLPVLYDYRLSSLFASAVLLGLAALCRDVYAPLVLAVPLLAWKRYDWKRAVLVALCSGFVVLPWMLRNQQRVGSFAISRGTAGVNLWVGTWERDGLWQATHSSRFPDYAFEAGEPIVARDLNEAVAHDAELLPLARQRVLHHPLRTAWRWLLRAPRMWVGPRDIVSYSPRWLQRWEPAWWTLKILLFVFSTGISVFGLMGCFVAIRKRQPHLAWLAVPIVYTLLIYIPFHSTETRYSQPVFPLLIAFAVLALGWIRRGGTETTA